MAEPNIVSPQTRSDSPQQKDGKQAAVPPPPVKPMTLGRKKLKLGPWIGGLLVAVIGVVFWYFFIRTPPPPPLIIRYAAIDSGSITRGITATGTLQATTTVQVGSQVSGLVKHIYADFNSKVRAGQLLAALDTAPYVAALTQASATETKARSDLELAKQNEARERQLLAQHLVAQSDYDASINALKDAYATVSQDSASYEQAKVNLGYCFVRSPVDGVVQARDVDSGQTVAAGLNVTVLYVIAQNLNNMQVAADVDEADIGQVADLQDVKFTVEAYPGVQFDGKVWQVQINPTTTSNVVTYTVIIRTPNPDGKLLPGMTATATIINATREDVVRVPVAATRFVPPDELIAQLPVAARDSMKAHRGMHRPASDSARRAVMGQWSQNQGTGPSAVQPSFSTVYVKTNTDKGPQFKAVRVVTGLQDNDYAEVLHSTPPLQLGDSVIVAAFSLTSATPTASSPLGTQQRPGGGGGRGGADKSFSIVTIV